MPSTLNRPAGFASQSGSNDACMVTQASQATTPVESKLEVSALKYFGHSDVLIAGGGPSGICAALSAARLGAKVTLVETQPFLGGNATLGLPLMTFHSFDGKQIIRGIPQEIVDRLIEEGGCTGHVPAAGAHMPTYTLVDAEIFKYVSMELLLRENVQVALHALVTDAVMAGNAAKGLVIASKSGIGILSADRLIDCTGDADVAARAGALFSKGRPADGGMQAMTLNLRLGNVDLDAITRNFGDGLIVGTKAGESEPRPIRGQGTFAPWQDQVDKEGLFPDHGHYLWWNSFREGEVNVNTTRIAGKDPTELPGLTGAEIEGRRQAIKAFRFLKQHVPGFERSHLISTGPTIGIRETRRILGESTLTASDVLGARSFDTSIARGSYPVDIHDPSGMSWGVQFVKDGGSYGIPYGCLVPQKVDNLLVAGRSISVDHEALGSTRVMAVCMALGQAAGAAAALSIAENVTPRALNAGLLRKRLTEQGAIV